MAAVSGGGKDGVSEVTDMATSSELQSVGIGQEEVEDLPATPLPVQTSGGAPPKQPQAAFGGVESAGSGIDGRDMSSRRRIISGADSILGSRGIETGRTLSGSKLEIGFDMDSAPKDNTGKSL